MNGLLVFLLERLSAHRTASVHSKPQTAGSSPSPLPRSCRLYEHIIFPKTDGTDIRYRFFLRYRQCQISTAGAGIAFFLLYIRFLLDLLLGVHFWVKPLFISVHKCQKRISHHFLPVLPLFLSASIPVFHPDLGNKYPQEIYHRFW